MSARPRPLSPHLQIYRWQISNTLSIVHRLTGVGLALGLPALAYWLVAASGNRLDYDAALGLFAGVPGRLALAAWTFAFFYHLLNGIRHLSWDIGRGFGRRARHASGWLVVAGALLAGAGVWIVALHGAH